MATIRSWLKAPTAALLVLLLAGCEYSGMVGNPKTGFTVKFPEKWQSVAKSGQMPDFVQQAQRFGCAFDLCGRQALGVGIYGRLPEAMQSTAGASPRIDDVVALLDQMLDLRGKLRERHVDRTTINGAAGFRAKFVLPNNARVSMVVLGNLVFHENRFLFYSVSGKVADEDQIEDLLAEVSKQLKRPGSPAV